MRQDMEEEEKDDEDEKVHVQSFDGSEIHKDSRTITSKVIVTTTPQKGHSKRSTTTDILGANSCLEYLLRDNNNKLRLKCVENGRVGPFVDLYQGCLDLGKMSSTTLFQYSASRRKS